ncbi:MAG: PAS domain S-box protein [Candidatus Hydrogenedentes bacterium]|nr:PAS domain S-box protein [Candidatus Hydrogenedentota bacterium]
MKAKPHDADTTPEVSAPVLSQEHLTTIFNASHDVVFVLDGESKTILHVNDTVGRVLGYTPNALFGTQFPVLVAESAPDYLEHCQFFDGVFGPVSFRRCDGELCQGDVTAAVIPWDGVPALLYTLRDATQRTALEKEKAALIHDLQQALVAVQRLSGLLPICANCKRIRDDEGYWETVERYISAHSGAHFSHGICPACREELYPGLAHNSLVDVSPRGNDVDERFWVAQEALEGHRDTLDRVTQLRLYAFQQ